MPLIEDKNGIRKLQSLIAWFEKIAANQRYLEDDKSDRFTEAENYLKKLFDVPPQNM